MLLVLLVVVACSTKKDSVVNRKWNAMNAKFNTLYNGHLALENGQQTLIDSYVDNYWELLPVERMEIRQEIIIDTSQLNPDFRRAELKATKAIQKYGMDIGGKERNPQIDQAYLLLGKARYYDQRFVPALEAFNYILRKYTDSDLIHQAGLWREKTNIRMENEEVAILNLKRIVGRNLHHEVMTDAYAMLAQAYINLEQKDSAIIPLKIASNISKDFEKKGRYNYIIGQLYNEKGMLDSANKAFDKILGYNRKTPRVYLINAYIAKTLNKFKTQPQDYTLREELEKMERNRENRPFLGPLYRLNALYYMQYDSLDQAALYFNKSLRNAHQDKGLLYRNYQALGTMYFDNSAYRLAGAYYDSTLTYLPNNTKLYRVLSRKRDNLDDVIMYEEMVSRNDSILGVLQLSQGQREAYYQRHIDSLLAIEQQLKEKQEIAASRRGRQRGFIEGFSQDSPQAVEFYFYNPTSVRYGIQEFKATWGDRDLEDNWRLGGHSSRSNKETVVTSDSTSVNPLYQLAYYLDRLPVGASAVDSLNMENNFANYQLGLLYKEKFQEYQLAAKKLETVLGNNPEERLILPSNYNLFKLYQQIDPSKAEVYKTAIIEKYPDSRYAMLLKNPSLVLREDQSSPEALYRQLYKDFENQEYQHVLEQSDSYISRFNAEDIAVKFEMLKATAIARLYGIEAYKNSLNEIALNYPNLPEGRTAKELLENSLSKIQDDGFELDEGGSTNWKLIYPFHINDTTGIAKLQKTIKESLEDLAYDKITFSKDPYNPETVFVTVHGFTSKLRAEGYAELLNINKDYLVDNENFVISSSDYKKIQIYKNLEGYLNQIAKINPSLNN